MGSRPPVNNIFDVEGEDCLLLEEHMRGSRRIRELGESAKLLVQGIYR